MGELASILKQLGIPAGVAGFIISAALFGDRLLARYAENQKAKSEESRAERQMLSTDQAEFRRSLLSQTEQLKQQLALAQQNADSATARHLDAERRVVEFQLTIARLAAILISNGVQLPPSAIPDLALTSMPPALSGKPA